MHKLLSALPLVAVLAVPAVMHADQISGQFSAAGSYTNDQTAGTLTFLDAHISNNPSDLYGAFASILSPSEVISATQQTFSYKNYAGGEMFSVLNGAGATVLTIALNDFSGQMLSAFGQQYFVGQGDVTFTDPSGKYSNNTGLLTFSSQGQGNVSFSATATTSPVPEPSTLALLGTGVLGAAGAIRRRFSI